MRRQRWAGTLIAYTGKEYTAYYLKTLDDQLEPSMDLISDMLKASAFPGGAAGYGKTGGY